MGKHPNKLKNSTSESIPRKLVKFAGFSMAFIGLIAAIITCIVIATGLFYDIWTRTGYLGHVLQNKYVLQQRFVGILLFIGMLCAPILCIGFLMYSEWKEDLAFAKRKLVVLSGFILFFPAPLINFFGVGVVPPIFSLFAGLLCCVTSSLREIVGFFLVGAATIFLFAVHFCFGHLFSCFVNKHTKNRYVSWVIFAILAGLSLFGKYIWGDVGGGEHGGNIIQLFADFF